jgi:hypothetical protein
MPAIIKATTKNKITKPKARISGKNTQNQLSAASPVSFNTSKTTKVSPKIPMPPLLVVADELDNLFSFPIGVTVARFELALDASSMHYLYRWITQPLFGPPLSAHSRFSYYYTS